MQYLLSTGENKECSTKISISKLQGVLSQINLTKSIIIYKARISFSETHSVGCQNG